MIHYNSLWETMSNKHFTTYTLREKHNIGHGTVQRLQKKSICQTRKRKRLIKNDSRIIWLNNGHILVALVTSIMDG